MSLKGQNFRICIYDSTAEKFKVIGMSTNCTVTLQNNVDESSTKDDTGMSSKPEVVSQGWSVQVESLNVADVGVMLTAIKSATLFTLLWDETSTTDNQTLSSQSFAYKGTAFLNDGSFNFNDREISTKSLQFTGSGALSREDNGDDTEVIPLGSYTRGQLVRLFLASNNIVPAPTDVIAAAKQLSLHVSLTLESATTKDTEGNWVVQEPTALNYDIRTTALVKSNETITSSVGGANLASLENIYKNGEPVKWQIANVSGANNRTKGSVIASGSAQLTQLTINAANRQTATYDAQLTGYGDYTVGS